MVIITLPAAKSEQSTQQTEVVFMSQDSQHNVKAKDVHSHSQILHLALLDTKIFLFENFSAGVRLCSVH